MAIHIEDICIVCGACVPECPNHAIYENGEQWRYADGPNNSKLFQQFADGIATLLNGTQVDVNEYRSPLSNEVFYIVPDKCTECKEYHEVPSCNDVCPVECCVPDPDLPEETEVLLAKKKLMHNE
jgi:ferredoxin